MQLTLFPQLEPAIVHARDYANIKALIRKHGAMWHYVGADDERLNLSRSALANPCTADDDGTLYAKWLYSQFGSAVHYGCSGFVPAIDELRSIESATVLVCNCDSTVCHGDIIVRAWKWWTSEHV